ncbi:putative C2H2 finger domain protein [Aspergillus undulatus]|uniref:putative C2H2 finger domain protein n=1 Tax=Aspergillus undulatus TaxID=1810928 RepID=UPI003CCD7124
MGPRGFTNPAPKTESARSALSSFTCTLCNKSYSRHPEYEAHIGSYDHQHRKRLQDLKQLSRDPNAAEKARRAEKKADAEAGLRVLETAKAAPAPSTSSGGGGGGFKKGGFKSSFNAVKGPAAPVAPTKKNVLGNDDDEGDSTPAAERATDAVRSKSDKPSAVLRETGESDTEEEYAFDNVDGGYYAPQRPTDCFPGCAGSNHASLA